MDKDLAAELKSGAVYFTEAINLKSFTKSLNSTPAFKIVMIL